MVGTAHAEHVVRLRFRTAFALCLVFAGVALASCDGSPERTTFRNTGMACIDRLATLFGECGTTEIPADVPLRINVDFATCTSSSCDTVLNAECRATRAGSVITIEAEAVIESEGNECTDDCGFVGATCEIEALPAGTYELRYGDASTSLTVPSTTAAGCVGEGLSGRCCDSDADCDGGSCENNRCR